MNTQHEQDYLNWYQRINSPGTPFDPSELVVLARAQWPDMPLAAEAFAHCHREWPESELYTHFLSSKERAARWNHCGCRELKHPTLGTLIVDLIADPTVPGGRGIGGLEYLDRVFARHMDAGEEADDDLTLEEWCTAHGVPPPTPTPRLTVVWRRPT